MKRLAASIPVPHKARMEPGITHSRRNRLGRVVLRPFRSLARRVRWYLMAEVGAELAASRVRQEAIQARQDYIVGMEDIILARLGAVEQLLRDRGREDAQAGVVAERLLLTLALENGALENGALENGALENGALENDAPESGRLAGPGGLSNPGDAG